MEIKKIFIGTKRDADTIPQFTGLGKYEIGVSLNGFKRTIEEYIKEGLELNPDFQRGHVWTRAQQISFIEFLLRGGLVPSIKLNHTDWMSFQDPNASFVVVDGLQRITAIMAFINDEIPAFGVKFSEWDERLGRRYTVKINVNDLKTRKEVLNWYVELNTGGTVHTEEEINKVRKLIDKEK